MGTGLFDIWFGLEHLEHGAISSGDLLPFVHAATGSPGNIDIHSRFGKHQHAWPSHEWAQKCPLPLRHPCDGGVFKYDAAYFRTLRWL